MKKINYLLVVLMSVLFCTASQSQETSTEKLQLLALYHEGEVLLRWIPTDYPSWKASCDDGYTLKRVHHYQTANDTLVISTDLKPLSESEWDAQFPNNESAASAKDLLYNTQNSDPIMNMQDMWDASQNRESKHLFAMILAEHRFDIATGLALAHKDLGVIEDQVYSYFLELNNNEEVSAAITIKASDNENLLPTVKGVKAMNDEDHIYIEWNDKQTEHVYTTYDVERSSDSISWGTCNEVPFMNLLTTQEEFAEEDVRATYSDSPPSKVDEYYYRVRGKSPFGVMGPPSKVVKMACAPPKMEFVLRLDGYEEVGDDVMLNWNSLSSDLNSDLAGFNIYRAKTSKEKPVKLNQALLPSGDRTYLDDDPLNGDTYYFIEAVDNNDYHYISLEMLVRRIDNTAPDKVMGINYEMIDFNTVKLRWDASEADDLRGYHVHVATVRDGKYSASTQKAITNNEYDYHITTGVAFDSLFFKVMAEDHRRNIAEDSDILGIARPDVFGPSAPVLGFASPMEGGIYFDWQYSSSDDVVKHELKRKKKVGNDSWETVLSITEAEKVAFSNNTNSEFEGKYSFLDSTDLYDEYYTYVFMAVDEAGNESNSKLTDVLPYRDAVVGAVTNFDMDVITIDNPPSSSLQKKINILSSRYSNAREIAGGLKKYDVKLEWDAVLDYSLSHFMIYRGIGDDPISPVLHISPAEGLGLEEDTEITIDSGIQTFSFTDTDAKKNKRYTYYIVRVERNGTESNKSTTLSERIPNQ